MLLTTLQCVEQPPKAKNYPTQNVNSVEVQTPCLYSLSHETQPMDLVKHFVFLSLFPLLLTSKGGETKFIIMGPKDWESSFPPTHTSKFKPLLLILGVTVITFFSIKITFPCLHKYITHQVDSEMQWSLTPWTQWRGRGPAGALELICISKTRK